MKYKFSFTDPHRHFIDIEMIIENNGGSVLQLQLPAWRPGRYELGNFAKNIQRWAAYDGQGNTLPSKKIKKDLWEVQSAGVSPVHIRYNYYADRLDAGSCRLDETQLYVNPVHCCLYVPGRTDEPHEIELKHPAGYIVATSLAQHRQAEEITILEASGYDELADSPFIASDTLKHELYEAGGTKFHIWFQGESKPDWKRLLPDFKSFTEEHIRTMGSFPAKEYHFLFQVLPQRFHHGVEHTASTVIAMGPSYNLMKEIMYYEFLGISSHELFHAWNVKAIRPAEMMPYNYAAENYSRLGFVTEGITTYYGDLLLYRAGCYSDFEYFKTVHKNLQKHFDNYGRFNLSVADSSFDTWLDGYSEGIPHRKTSIYTEGCLCALMVDLLTRRKTGNRKSLDDVMRVLYNDFGKKGKGYSEKDYQSVIEEVSGTPFGDFFRRYYFGTEDYEPLLNELLGYIGLEIVKTRSRLYFENRFGFKSEYTQSGSAKITVVAPGSIADRGGLTQGDEITSINGIELRHNLKEWCKYFEEEPLALVVQPSGKTKEVVLTPGEERYFRIHYPYRKKNISADEQKNFESWSHRKG